MYYACSDGGVNFEVVKTGSTNTCSCFSLLIKSLLLNITFTKTISYERSQRIDICHTAGHYILAHTLHSMAHT